MSLSKRDVLLAITALAASAAIPASAQSSTLDLAAGHEIGAAYRAAYPAADLAAIRRDLLPNGFTAETAPALRNRVADDFRNARVFIFKGWRISETEARLFALLT